MKARTIWKEKMQLEGEARGHRVDLDAKSPLGNDTGFTPKELVAIGICGCTAMDIASLLKKYKQPLESMEVSADITQTEGVHPAVFKDVILNFVLTGKLEKEKVIEAVHLSQSKFCGVSAMIAKTAPIHYKIVLNGEEISRGEAAF